MDTALAGGNGGIKAAGHTDTRFDIPVVYITDGIDEPTLEELKHSQPFGCIFKPFKEEELQVAIELALLKHAEEKRLRSSERMLRMVADHMHDMVRLTDMEGNNLYFSPSHQAVLGYTAEERIGRSNFELVHPDDLEMVLQVFTDALANARPARVEYRARRADGQYIWVETIGDFAYDDKGNVAGIVMNTRDVTQRREMEAALRESEERYRTIIAEIEDGYWEVDLAGRFTFLNQATCEMAGFSGEELRGMSNLDYTTPETAKRLYETFNEVYRTGQPASLGDYEVIRKDGIGKTLELSVSLIKDKTGDPVGFRGIARDVTERRAMERALRESEESYRTVLELSPDAIVIARRKGWRYVQVNEAFCRHTGYAAEEAIGRTAEELNLYADLAEGNRLVDIMMQEGRVDGFEIQFQAKDGTILDDLVSVRTVRFRGETCFLIVATVVTSLKEAQKALSRSEEKYRTILESIEDGYWEVDVAGRFTFFNDAVHRMVGYSREELSGMSNRDYTDPKTARRIYTIFNEVYRTGKPANIVDYEVIKKDKSTAAHEMSVSLMRDKEGNPVGFRGVSRDITPRKRAEEEIRAHREHLALINQILSHDLMNDLLAVHGSLTLYDQSPEKDLLKDASDRVKKSMDLISRMRELEDFIAFHKELKVYQLRDVVNRVAGGYPSLTFVIKGKARVMADDTLFPLMNNIVHNAVVHGNADRVEIGIRREGNLCEVHIADNGLGVADDIKKAIFDKGFMHGTSGHTGLGLNIVKKAMERYGGYVSLGDNKPHGAVFTLTFRMVG